MRTWIDHSWLSVSESPIFIGDIKKNDVESQEYTWLVPETGGNTVATWKLLAQQLRKSTLRGCVCA